MKGRSSTRQKSAPDKDVAAFKRVADAFVKKATASPEFANATLVELGVYTAKGHLTKPYRR